MKYKDLFDVWSDAREKKLPPRFSKIKSGGSLKPKMLSADDTQKVSNAISPYDLYNNPDPTPSLSSGGYGTSAYQISRTPGGIGVEDLIAIITRGSKNRMSTGFPVQSTVGEYSRIPKEYHKYIPQAQYEHEKVHYQRPRIFDKNYGYMTRLGMPGDVGSEEARAMGGEDRFWGRTIFKKK